MMPIEPFNAEADFAHEGATKADMRDVKVIGVAEGTFGMGFVAIETVDGWQYVRHVDSVRRKP
ncbi:hypothetical protein [Pelagibacterium mangrovi]|uniref:hypothetical protein n=1 Tax=Pelagibacterium mangrovi TaxID=3119828 RepID=UPI002FCC106F